MTGGDQPPAPDAPPRKRLLEVAGLFTRLGFTAFGGPAAHLSLIEDEVVTRRRWIDRRQFLDIVSAINFIPGPNSTELCIHLGLIRAGHAGLLVAGACFILPAVLIILPIAWAYVTYGTLPRVGGAMALINCAVVAIVAMAAVRFVRTSITRRLHVGLAIAASAIAVGFAWFHRLQPELCALALAGIIGAIATRRSGSPAHRPDPPAPPTNATPAGAALPALLAGSPLLLEYGRLALAFLKIGATLFGSGYVLVSYLRTSIVGAHGWMNEQQLLDAIAVGQFTPGPLLTTATFVGYVVGHTAFAGGHVGGIVGAIVATTAIFLPSFVFVAVAAPALDRLRQHPLARGALDAMNAAVAALLVVVTVQIAHGAFATAGWTGIAVAAVSGLALWRNVNATWLIIAAGGLGAWISG